MGARGHSTARRYLGSVSSQVVAEAPCSVTVTGAGSLSETPAPVYSNNVSVVSNSQITFANAGLYNIQFSLQLLNYTTSEDNVTMWFRKNGVDIPNTAGIVTVPSKHGGGAGTGIVSWNLVVDLNAGQYIELMMTSDSGNTVVATYPPGTAPVHPASPSVILTATFVSSLNA